MTRDTFLWIKYVCNAIHIHIDVSIQFKYELTKTSRHKERTKAYKHQELVGYSNLKE